MFLDEDMGTPMPASDASEDTTTGATETPAEETPATEAPEAPAAE